MSASNGKPTGPTPNPEVERLLEIQRDTADADAWISDRIGEAVAALLEAYPNHHERIARRLEARADKIRAAYEAKKRREREDANRRR